MGPSPLKPKEERPDGIQKKITELEKVSQACVSTVGERVHAYWMMSEDLGKQVFHISDKFDSLLRTVYEIEDENKKIMEVMKKQQTEIVELTTCFAFIAHVCTLKIETKKDEEDTQEEEKTPATKKE